MVFQQFYLFPHLTALENVMFRALRVRGAKKEAAEKLAGIWKSGLAERAHPLPASRALPAASSGASVISALAVKPK